MSGGDQDCDSKVNLSADAITEECLDLSRGIADDDKLLWKKDKNAVDFSLNYAKLWCKFCKDLVSALEKKASIETESCRSLSKQMQGLDSTLSSSNMIGSPLRSETLAMSKLIVDQCKEIEIQNSKRLGKLLDVISRQRTEFSKTRKLYKDKWKSDCKKMSDAENLMWKTRASYYQRCQQGVKLREELESSQSLLTYMLDHGIQDGASGANVTPITTTVGQSSAISANIDMFGSSNALPGSTTTNANDAISSSQLSKQKAKVDKLEKQLADNDKKEIEMMYSYKESVENANNRLIEFEKKKLEHLCDIRLTTARNDEVVKDTMAEYLRILFETRTTMLKEYSILSEKFQEYKPCQEFKNLVERQGCNKPDVYSEKFQVELFHDSAQAKEKSESQSNKGMSLFGMGGKDSDQDSSHRSTVVNRGVLTSHSDSDSDSEINTTIETNISSGSKGAGVLNTIVEFGSNLFRPGSSGGGTQFDSRRTQSQIKSKKSTSGSTSSMTGNNEVNEKDFEWQKEVEVALELILKCITLIEVNGLTTHGIYRVSASKLKIGSVIDALNNLGMDANLENEQPITLASVVKSKLISLSEPLIPYSLYTEFVELGKEAELGEVVELVAKLGFLINQLPLINKKLAGLVLHHLKKVANNCEENQMGSTNLGTLFAPTLIKAKPRFKMADIKEYMDNKSQAKIVQLMIENVEELFGVADQYYIFCKSTLDDNDVDKMKIETAVTVKSESVTKSSRPRSSIIESSDSLQTKAESPSSRPLSGSFIIPITAPTPNYGPKVVSEKSAPRLMDMLEPETSSNLRANSPRLRERKLLVSNEVENESLLLSQASVVEKVTTNIPQRSISLGSGPSPDAIKLVQLSQPSNDSIFSKAKETETVTSIDRTSSFNTASERSLALRRSFLSSNENASSIVTSESRYSSVRNSHVSQASRPGSSTSRSHFSHSSDLELPCECDNRQSNSLESPHKLSCVPIRESLSSTLSFAAKHFIDITPSKTRAHSHASPTEINIVRHKIKYNPYSPFIRHSNLRTPFIARSVSDLRGFNPSYNFSLLTSSPKRNRKTISSEKISCSLDHIADRHFIDNYKHIEKYQRWLSETMSAEFFV